MAGFRIERRDGNRGGNFMMVPFGRLDCDTGLKMEDELIGFLRSEPVNLIIDFKNISFISDEGMGMLLGIVSSFRGEGVSVDLINVPGKIEAKIKMVGADKYFEDIK